ncbi:glycosyltransferase [Pseudohongiella sp. SYSU M77423]|uniref:glycosyltransferase n=1 Tax=Pseudohongiella sp. SYSU M77423 TaxID=3042312 RepID=UPI0024805474|nr:glycosyltransferase [Pseudohongiella sp. SYSU M77423]MDH7942938.1 glycosyltransferase [Pseudohongiella sp. SYSU M77423]
MNIKPTDVFGDNFEFSVLMSVYRNDNPQLLVKAVESCFLNTVTPLVLILVIDGPITDQLEQKISDLESKYPLSIVRLPENVGLAEALNVGLKHVKTEWVARADSDDINMPFRFETQLRVLSDNDYNLDIIGSSIIEVDSNGSKVATRRPPYTHQEILNFSKQRNPFNHMTVMYRKSKVIACGGYPNIYLKEDYALWATMLVNNARAINIETPLVTATAGKDMYRRRGGIKYALAEVKLQKHLVNLGLKSMLSGVIDGFLRASVFLMPAKFRELIYLAFLRNSSHSPSEIS